MNANRLIKFLSALSVVVMLALPAAAFAMPSLDNSGSTVTAHARNYVAPTSRAVYYAAKERQMEHIESRYTRPGSRVVSQSRVARPISYATFKEQQIERIMNGE